jgi:hypothetical protein
MTTKWLERQRNGRMAPPLRRLILVLVIVAGVALAAYVAVAFGGLVLDMSEHS